MSKGRHAEIATADAGLGEKSRTAMSTCRPIGSKLVLRDLATYRDISLYRLSGKLLVSNADLQTAADALLEEFGPRGVASFVASNVQEYHTDVTVVPAGDVGIGCLTLIDGDGHKCRRSVKVHHTGGFDHNFPR